MSRLAIVAALEREVRPLIGRWHVTEKEHSGRHFRFFENGNKVLICGGIGAEAARRATEAILALYAPGAVCSVGFAGALDPALKVAHILHPHIVINASDASRTDTGTGEGTLVTFSSVASPEQKAKLRHSYSAAAVDMEAAAVARAADARGVRFAVVKVISDEFDFTFPSTERFIDANGQFLEARFALFAAVRPWLWPQVVRLARNSSRASRALCNALTQMTADQIPSDTLEAAHRS